MCLEKCDIRFSRSITLRGVIAVQFAEEPPSAAASATPHFQHVGSVAAVVDLKQNCTTGDLSGISLSVSDSLWLIQSFDCSPDQDKSPNKDEESWRRSDERSSKEDPAGGKLRSSGIQQRRIPKRKELLAAGFVIHRH